MLISSFGRLSSGYACILNAVQYCYILNSNVHFIYQQKRLIKINRKNKFQNLFSKNIELDMKPELFTPMFTHYIEKLIWQTFLFSLFSWWLQLLLHISSFQILFVTHIHFQTKQLLSLEHQHIRYVCLKPNTYRLILQEKPVFHIKFFLDDFAVCISTFMPNIKMNFKKKRSTWFWWYPKWYTISLNDACWLSNFMEECLFLY